MHLLVRFRVHEMEIIALFVEVLKFNFVENGAVDKFFSAEAIVNHRAILKIFHARLHGAALVAGSAVVDAKNREKLALVLDNHAGAELCSFDAAHNFLGRAAGRLLKIADSEIPAGGRYTAELAARGMTCLRQAGSRRAGAENGVQREHTV
jgi:hypothetical protein